jgi:hypothetical protein
MDAVVQVMKWVGGAGVVAGIASLVGAFSNSLAFSYAGISLPDTFPGAIAILAGGVILIVLASILAKKSSCGCCGGKDSE